MRLHKGDSMKVWHSPTWALVKRLCECRPWRLTPHCSWSESVPLSPELIKSDPLPCCYPRLLPSSLVFIWSPGSCPPGPAGSLWHPVSHTWAEHLPGFCALWHEISARLWHARRTPGKKRWWEKVTVNKSWLGRWVFFLFSCPKKDHTHTHLQ